MNLVAIGIIGTVIMLILIMLGVNIGLAMALTGFVGYIFTSGFNAAINMVSGIPFTQSSTYSFSVIPLFVVMGQLSLYSGISSGLFKAADKWLCNIKGGLAIATIGACAFFAAICGSTTATCVTMATLALPEMRKAKYADSLSTGCLAAGGTLGVLIPPSTIFVIYGITAEQPIGMLFAAGIIPGIILALAYMATIYIECLIKPQIAPQTNVRFTFKEKTKALIGVLPTIILFLAVIGGMFAGFFSSTEAAAIGVFLSLIFMIIGRRFKWKHLLNSLIESAKTCGMIFLILFGAMAFGYFIAVTGLPGFLAELVSGLGINRYLVMLILMVIFLILGCIMDTMPIILITVPILLPIVLSLGFSPIWYGVLMVMVSNLGCMTPPVGLNLFVIGGTAKDVPMSEIIRGTFPFVIAAFAVTALLIVCEPLSTWLPSIIYGI